MAVTASRATAHASSLAEPVHPFSGRLRLRLAGAKGPPIEPISPLPRLSTQPFAPAAVLVAIVDHAEPTVLLTERRANMRRHAGEISFPGGRIDPGDADAVAAALREAQEEICLDPNEVEVLGALDPVVVGTGFIVTPIVGLIRPDLRLVACEAEVESLFEVPLWSVTDPARQRLETVEFAGATRSFYVIEHGNRRIWGATARMLVELGKRLR